MMTVRSKPKAYINYNRHLPFVARNVKALYDKLRSDLFHLSPTIAASASRYCLGHPKVNVHELTRAMELLVTEAYTIEYPEAAQYHITGMAIPREHLQNTLIRACIIADRRK